MEGKIVSEQQVIVLSEFMAAPKNWFESQKLHQKTMVPASTVRHLLFNFFKLGILERSEVLGSYRYRLSPTAEAQPYFARVLEAATVMRT
jgi:DNA-binding IclR family transcriptional regulator